jgi:hypothetical protein
MEMHTRVNTYYRRNLNTFFIEKAFYFMKDVIVWNTFAEF